MIKHTSSPIDSTVPKRAVIWKAVSSERQAHEDKVSLPEQEELAREWCKANAYTVVRVLEVDGYSRRESDVITALQDFEDQGIYAYSDLRKMWQNKEFDVLVAYTHDRFGRSNTLHSYVVENVIQNGMSIYFLLDGGFVTVEDFRYKLAIGGMMAATPIDRLIKAAAVAKDKLITQGLPTGPMIPISHRLVRDPQSGKALYVELNPEYRQLFEELATIFLEGVAYNFLSRQLKSRFGHTNRAGNAYRWNLFYDLFYTPMFWGHMARRYTDTSIMGNMRGAWVFDETIAPPEGVIIARNVVPAVYTGEMADAIRAELYRRMDVSGKRDPKNPYRFAGLFLCGECGSSMSVKSKRGIGRIGVKCSAQYSRIVDKNCTQNLMTPHRYLQAQFENMLEQFVSGANPEIFTLRYDQKTDDSSRLEKYRSEREKIQHRISAMIRELSDSPESARPLYRQQIEQESLRLERIAGEMLIIERKLAEEREQTREEIRTLDELKKLSLDCFWRLPDREINKWLRRLMGKRKFVVVNREIVDVVELPPRKRKSRHKKK